MSSRPRVAVMAIANAARRAACDDGGRVRLEPNAARVVVTLPVTLRVEEHRWTRDALKRSFRQAA